ncbi:MAG: hypothetical protein WC571_02240 [Candidatus Omnitrophota bacterium]
MKIILTITLFLAIQSAYATPPLDSLQGMGADKLAICYQQKAFDLKPSIVAISQENIGIHAVDLFWKCEDENRYFSGRCASYYGTTGNNCNMASIELAKEVLISVIGAEE